MPSAREQDAAESAALDAPSLGTASSTAVSSFLASLLNGIRLPLFSWTVQQDTFGDAAAAALLRERSVTALKDHFASIPSDWSERYFYPLAMSRHFPLETLEQWAGDEPYSADAQLILGARRLKWSWEARGYGRGASVSQERWAEFYRRLDITWDTLVDAARLRPEDPTPWANLIMVAVYHGYGEDDQLALFNEAVGRDPDNWIAHMHRLTGLAEKWGGSHQQMFEFAHETAFKADERSLLPVLVMKAHSKYWKYLYAFDDDEEAAEHYIRQEQPKAEALAAYERSLGSFDYEPRAAVFARINAAGWFWLAKSQIPLRRELNALGTQIKDVHWRWVGTEVDLGDAQSFASASWD